MQSVAIFGPGGQLGSDLHILLPNATPIFRSKVDFSKLTSLQELEAALAPDRFEYFINCAAITDVAYCEANPAEAVTVNANAPRILAEYCCKHNTYLVHISSDFVFDGAGAPYEIEAPRHAVNVYGQTKIDAEQAIETIFRQYDLHVCNFYTMIRTSSLFGVAHGRTNFIEKMIDTGLKRGTVKSANWRTFIPTSTKSLAEKIVDSVVNNTLPRGVVHAVSTPAATQTEIASFIFQNIPSLQHVKIVGSDKETTKPARPPNSSLVPSSGWQLCDWHEEIAAYLLWKGYSRPPCVLEVEADAPYSISKVWEKLGRKQPNYPELVAALREDRTNFIIGKKPTKGKKKSIADVLNGEPGL